MNPQSKSDQLLTLLNELIPSYEKSANELHDKAVLMTQLAAETMKESNELRKLVSMLRLTIHDHITQSKVDQITKSVQQHHESERIHVFEEAVPVAPHTPIIVARETPASVPQTEVSQTVTPTPNGPYSHALMNERIDMSNVSLPNHTHVSDTPNPVKTSSPSQVMNHETMEYEVDKEKLLDEFEAGTVTTSVMDLPIDMVEQMPNVDFSK